MKDRPPTTRMLVGICRCHPLSHQSNLVGISSVRQLYSGKNRPLRMRMVCLCRLSVSFLIISLSALHVCTWADTSQTLPKCITKYFTDCVNRRHRVLISPKMSSQASPNVCLTETPH